MRLDPITQLIFEGDGPCNKLWLMLDEIDTYAHKYTGGSVHNVDWSDKRIPPALKKKRAMIKLKIKQCEKIHGGGINKK